MKLVNAIFKEDPILRELRKINLTTDTLTVDTIAKTVAIF